MSYDACIAAVRKASGIDLTDDQVGDLVERLAERAELLRRKSGGTMGQGDALAAAARQLGEEERQAAAVERRNALLNLNARLARRARIAAAPDPILGIQAEIHGINTPTRGGRFAAEGEGRTLDKQYWNGAIGELEKAGLFNTARNGTLEREWVRELAEISKGADGQPGITKSEPARQIAGILHKYQELAKANLNRAGAWIGDYAGYVAHTNHDPDRMWKAGYEAWRATVLPLLDIDRTFGSIGGEGGVVDKEGMLHGIYNALVTGVHLTQEGGQGIKDPAFSGPGNLAKRMSQGRILHWKDADAWLDYQQKFGQANAMQAVMGNFTRAARDTALMRRYGTNPRAEFQGDLRHFAERFRDSDPGLVRRLRQAGHDLQNRFDFLDGTADMPANRLGARIGSAVRVSESMAKLGGVSITHLSVGATKSAELRYHGVGLLERYGDFLASFTRGRGAGETREIMDLLGAGIEGMQRDILARFSPDDTMPGTLSKLANLFFKLTGLTYMVNAQKAGAEFTMARHLGRLLATAHDALPAETQRTLYLYRIDPLEWEMLRRAPAHPAIDGRAFLTPDAAKRVPAKTAEAYLRGTGAIADKTKPDQVRGAIGAWRDDLAMRLHTLYHDIADRSIITPGIPEKALLLGGTRPGTLWGEALRFIAQFKQWPAASIRQGVGREIYGGQGKMMAAAGILHMALGSTILGYLAMTLKDATKGRTPRDPLDPKTWEGALMQGGGFGILADYLFGDYNRFGQNFGETLLGPVLGQGLGTVIDLWNRMKEGQDLAPETLRAVLDNTPFLNLFYTRSALNYLFLYQVEEALNPGFLRRYERSIRQNNHQGFIISPARSVPYGGRR